MNIRSIMAAMACALAATLIFAAIASGDPETIVVVVECDDCDELDGYEITVGDNTYVLTLPTPTPTPTATPELTPTVTAKIRYVRVTAENMAMLDAVMNGAEFHGRLLTSDEKHNIRWALRQAQVANFILDCLIANYEYPTLTDAVHARWKNAEFIGDVSYNPIHWPSNAKHFEPEGMVPDRYLFVEPPNKMVRSVYQIADDLFVVAKMGVKSEDCSPRSPYYQSYPDTFYYNYALYDDEKDTYVEVTWHAPRTQWSCCKPGGISYPERVEGYWERGYTRKISEHYLSPLTNDEVESGNIKCRINCDGADHFDELSLDNLRN